MKKEKGITLVTLVVTIIVLIILAGVSLNATIGDDGIITKAKQARENIIYAGKEEQEQLNQLFWELEQNGSYTEDEEDAKKDQMIELLQKQVEELKGQVAELQGENTDLEKQVAELNGQIDNLNKQINDLKEEVAEKDIEIADLKEEVSLKQETINNLQGQLDSINSQLAQTNATAAQILKDYKAYSGGKLLVGTMENRGAVSASLNAGQSYTIPAGYHNGNGKVTANSLASQTQATATAEDIAEGKTAYVNGEKIVGTGNSSGNYLMGSEYMENDMFSPSTEAHNRNAQSVEENGYVTTTETIDLTSIQKIRVKVHVYHTGEVGIGVSTTMPTSLAECRNVSTKAVNTAGTYLANTIQEVEYDVSSLTGKYYLFLYSTHSYNTGIFYWKLE